MYMAHGYKGYVSTEGGREIFLINGLRTPVYTCVHDGPPQTLILSKIIADENDARSKGMFAM